MNREDINFDDFPVPQRLKDRAAYATQRLTPEQSPFLVAFGQPKREGPCACERADEPTVDQALQLLNGLSHATTLFLMASGLTLIFGVLVLAEGTAISAAQRVVFAFAFEGARKRDRARERQRDPQDAGTGPGRHRAVLLDEAERKDQHCGHGEEQRGVGQLSAAPLHPQVLGGDQPRAPHDRDHTASPASAAR